MASAWIDNSTDHMVFGFCPYAYQQSEYFKQLNSSMITYSNLNEAMCGPLNREGLFCSRCKAGYGIPVYSKDVDECVKCGSKLSWLSYFALQLIPLTLFYFLVIIFNFSATRPPITAYIFYCQLFTQIPDIILKHHLKITPTQPLAHNLDSMAGEFECATTQLPAFCLDENLGAIEAVFLELISYSILFLITVTYILLRCS